MAKKAIIIGAGPAGLAAACTLAGKKDLEVTLIDQGREVMKRHCPSPKKCIKCKLCGKSSGVGGAGAYADGKFNFETIIGKREVGTNLHEIIGRSKERDYLKKAELHYVGYGLEIPKIPTENLLKAENIWDLADKKDIDYIFARQTHVGTDKLPEFIDKIEKDLIRRGVNIITLEKIASFDPSMIHSEKSSSDYDFLIVAPGRKGAVWLEDQLQANKIGYGYRAVDIGFRMETSSRMLKHLTDVARDVKFEMMVPAHGYLVRTFCVCPNGVVTRETYEDSGFNLVNGASDSKELSENTNFALLASVPLTDNANCNHYGDAIARVYRESGIDKPVLQQLGDIKRESRSRAGKTYEWRVQPTLADVHIGDVGLGMVATIQSKLLEAIKMLSAPGLMDGLNNDSTLIYAPEIKRNGLDVRTDGYCRTSIPQIRVAGDGSGKSRSIVGAAASGILAAEGILNDL